MNIRERIMAVINGEKPDRIPVFCYTGLAPLITQGAFERKMRNAGLGLLLYESPISVGTPNVPITKRKSKNGEETIYHTPLGDLTTEEYTNVERISVPQWPIKSNYFIKDVKDYEALIYLINDTVFYLNLEEFKLKDRDLGEDGIMRMHGLYSAYSESHDLLGVTKWSYEQYDHSKEFSELLSALNKRSELLINLIREIDKDFYIFSTIGDIRDSVSPASCMKYEVPFYKKALERLKSKNKKWGIHAHGSMLKGYKEILSKLDLDFIESYTPPPYSDLPLHELREAVGENVTIMINFPETIFFKGYEKTKDYTIELLKNDSTHNKMIGFSEMGMMGVKDKTRNIFEDGFQAVVDAIDNM